MGKQVIKLNEEQLNALIRESVVRVLNESEDEGLFKNIWSGIKGAASANREANFNASDVNTDYADANTNFNGMLNGVKSKKDAARTYKKMIDIARDYEDKAKQLMSKMRTVGANNDIDRAQNREGGRFAKGHTVTDRDTMVASGVGGDLAKKGAELRDKRSAMADQQLSAVQSGQGSLGAQRNLEEARIRQIVRESVYQVINESEDEGLMDMLRGFRSGYKTQKTLDTDDTRYRSDAKRRHDATFQGSGLDKLADKLYYKDAKGGVEKMAAMAKEYREKAQAIRAKAKELADKWGVGRVSPVGQTGPAQYGYVQKNPAAPAISSI